MRRLPPLPRIEPLPPGPFNPFTATAYAPSPPSSQDSFPSKSTCSTSDHLISPPSPASSVDLTLKDTFSAQKAFGWPNDLSYTEIMSLVAPRNINRKPPLQQLCGRKRKNDMVSSDQDDQREKHRIAEGNRRKNLSQLHRELDSRVHDFFLEKAGWNPSKSLPQSKEHIVQGAIFLLDFMLSIIVHLLRQEKHIPPHLSENLQGQLRCMQLQQLVSSLQSQNQATQQQMRALKQEYDDLHDRYRALEFKLKSYDQMFHSPKTEVITPPPLATIPESSQKKMLPGLRVFCDEVAALSPDPEATATTSSTMSHSFGAVLHSTPPATNPSSPLCPTPSFPHTFLPFQRGSSHTT
ncbi:HLH DNA binding domain protein [Talaromyces proteolyticus]|uniref:HLH DNA binding domain protein n=1 Tax=Talaromyces proteolyticus TaxID=1131652 RepID=A0AAD4KJZ0_9EURO|nr:HLH DNA binding domain protein [Talaromyces proteolyticus]KAH8693140.1 HLH DNA binding domain protein [Talaromyces proteolyticus]